MALTKYKIKQLIALVDEKNRFKCRKFYGVNIHKEFMPTAANTNNLDESKYKIVRKNRFVYSGMQTGRDECIRLSMYSGDDYILVSPAYTTFEISATDVIHPLYFFMLFLSKEKDRYGAFCSDGSIRSNLDWEAFCDIEISLPPISIQQKYVNIYNAMLANQKSYEHGLDDLKHTFETLLDEYKQISPKRTVGSILREVDCRNVNNAVTDVQGINISKQFMPSIANTHEVDLSKYKVVQKGQFAFSGMQTGRDECIRVALFDRDSPVIISPAYTVLESKDPTVLSEYVMMWFSRKEVDRLGWFMSDASIRTNLDKDRFYEIEIPVPDIKIQQDIVDIFKVYNARKEIAEKLKAQIQNICPILIKGSIEEGMRTNEA